MAMDKDPLGAFTATAERMTRQTQEAMLNYFDWLQKAMSTSPWSNIDLNTKLLNYVTQNVAATFAFVQKLSQATNFQEVVKIQAEFMEKQMHLFNEQAKILTEIYSRAAEDAMKGPTWMSPHDSFLASFQTNFAN
jgi:hypothetical protein